MDEFQLRYDELRDPQFWKRLNPDLTVNTVQRPIESEKIALSDDVIRSVKASLQNEGYFVLHEVLDKDLMDRLAKGVERIYRANLPTPFAIMYDEYWQIFHTLRGLLEPLLGKGYKQIPNFWCWFIDRSSNSKGWGHHRDRPAVRSVDQTGMPSALTFWIPLTDADASNGCMYVLPSKYDKNFWGDLDQRSIDEYQNVRALPAKRGSVLSWSENLLHWGSRSSDNAANPRVSISFGYQRADVSAYESPLIETNDYPDFNQSLRLIGQNICNYEDRSLATPEVLSAARRFNGWEPTIFIQNGQDVEVFDQDKRLSESRLWKIQEKYFADKQMDSWKLGDVPFYATSRMPFVEGCAELLVSSLLDCQATLDFSAPFYILELGGGLGCFAQRFLSEFLSKKADFEVLDRLKWVYVLSDFSEAIVQQHFDNPCLKEFFDSGVLDVACFRPEDDRTIKLLKAKTVIERGTMKNPLFVVANYLFDSIRHDAYRVIPSKILQEARYSLYKQRNTDEDEVSIEDVKFAERFSDVSFPHYGEPELDSILQHYRDNLEDASIIFPVGALKSIKNLNELSNEKLILLSTDKGFSGRQARKPFGLVPQHFAKHGGAFSFDVNFDAIARYMINKGGRSLSAGGDYNYLCTLFGTTLKSKLSLAEHIFKENLQNSDAFNSTFNIEEVVAEFAPEHRNGSATRLFLSIVKNFNCEPKVFTLAFQKLNEAIEGESEKIDATFREELVAVARRTFRNIYPSMFMDAELDSIFRFCILTKSFQECLNLTQAALARFGSVSTAFDHAAMACEHFGDREKAHHYFAQSLQLNPDHDWARKGMEKNKPLVQHESNGEEEVAEKKPGLIANWIAGWKR